MFFYNLGEDLMRDDIFVMWLSHIKGIRVKIADRLMEHFGTAKAVYNADKSQLAEVVGDKISFYITKATVDDSLEKLADNLKKSGANYISKYNKNFPYRLKNIDDIPIGIYYKGNLPKDNIKTVAMVGSRRCTEYGKHSALELSGELADCGIIIVSGLADGVDSYSHIGCIEHGGVTVAVLGTAIDKCYPAINIGLYDRIIECGGCIISEYGPEQETYASDFVKRNRIISGLADVLIVVEAEKKSGTSSTVDAALKYGRSVFAVPGSIFSKYSEGTNRLIRDGCPPVLGAGDILVEMGIYKEINKELENNKKRKEDIDAKLDGVSEAGKIIIDSLGTEPMNFETLALKTGIKESKLRSELTILEIRKIIRRQPGQRYILII